MDRWTLPARSAAGLAIIAVSGLILALLALPTLRSRPPASWPELSGLALLPGPEAAVRVDQLADRGDAAVAVWVPLLGDSRQEVAEAARRGLARRLDRWQLLDARAATPLVTSLAQGLSQHVGDFGPDGRQRASDLVMRLLSWPLGADHPDTRRLIDDCQAVLQLSDGSSRAVTGRLAAATDPSEPISAAEVAAGDAVMDSTANESTLVAPTTSPFPDIRELPFEITRIPALPDRRPQRSVVPPPAEPRVSSVAGESSLVDKVPQLEPFEARATNSELPRQEPARQDLPRSESPSAMPADRNPAAPPSRRLDLRR